MIGNDNNLPRFEVYLDRLILNGNNVPQNRGKFRQNKSHDETQKRRPCQRRTTPKSRVPGTARHSQRLPFPTTTPLPDSSQGPAHPIGAGLALTGSGAAEYPQTRGNAATVGAERKSVEPLAEFDASCFGGAEGS